MGVALKPRQCPHFNVKDDPAFSASNSSDVRSLVRCLQAQSDWEGEILLPTDSNYNETAAIFNSRTQTHPAVILRPGTVEAAQLAVKTAWESGLKIRLRGGGHSDEGYCSSNGVQIDTRLLNEMSLNLEQSTVQLGAGVLWRDAYEFLDGTGYGVPGGLGPSVGVVGYTTGGGFNHYLSRNWGMACDNAESFKVILYNGEILHVDASEHSDLWWALRGGGGGNFGLIVEVEMKLHPAGGDGEDQYTVSTSTYDCSNSAEFGQLIDCWATFTEHLLDIDERRVGTTLERQPDGIAKVRTVWSGGLAECSRFDDLLGQWHELSVRAISEEVSIHTWLQFAKAGDMPWDIKCPFEMRWYGASAFVTKITADIRNGMLEQAESHNSLLFEANFEAGSSQAESTAFPHRAGNYLLNPLYFWQDEKDDEQVLAKGATWLEGITNAPEYVGSYINYIDAQLDDWDTRYHGKHLSRLQAIKRAYDPHCYWSFPQGLSNAPSCPEPGKAESCEVAEVAEESSFSEVVQELQRLANSDSALRADICAAWSEAAAIPITSSDQDVLSHICEFFEQWLHLVPLDKDEQLWDSRFTPFYLSEPGKKLIQSAPFKNWMHRFVLARADFMNSEASAENLEQWFQLPGINMEDFIVPEQGFPSFNSFFTRRLRPSARKIDGKPDASIIVSPADGKTGTLTHPIDFKGETFDLEHILGSRELAKSFAGGTGLFFHLSPTDYHRWHSPVRGRVTEVRDLGSDLWPVEGIEPPEEFYGKNARKLFVIESDAHSDHTKVALVAVGNSVIGSISSSVEVGQFVEKGEELGCFAYGGSAIAMFFEPGRFEVTKQITEEPSDIRLGQQLGQLVQIEMDVMMAVARKDMHQLNHAVSSLVKNSETPVRKVFIVWQGPEDGVSPPPAIVPAASY